MDEDHVLLYKSNMLGAAQSTIRSYNLFGETRDLPDVVHCETIPARAALYGWEVAPHRHARLHQVLLISSGSAQASLEGNKLRLRSMDVVNVPTGHVHGYSFKPSTQGWVLTFAAELIDQMLIPSEGLGRVLSEIKLVRATTEMRKLMMSIFAEYGARDYARAHILRASSAVLLGLIARAIAARQPDRWHAAGPELVRRFEALVDTHFLEHWPVARYADQLKVTPTHLSRLTREAYGCPASQVIRDRIVREARRNLVYTNLPVSTIAYALGFDDPAHFSRTFAAATGLSPSDFRNRMQSL